jgi:putative ABC transport system ATP-binding protein
MNTIELKDIHKEYLLGRTHVHALRGVSLTIKKGEFIAVAGPSGSGKTTLLNIIGLIDKPDRGRVTLKEKDTTGESLNRLSDFRRETIGFIFQTFNLIPVLSAYENVEYPLLFSQMTRRERRERIRRLLDIVGIASYSKHRPYELSGGQRQRVAIARALVNNPEVVLADEPTANLDSRTGGEILDEMRRLNRELNVTFLFASHDPLVLERVDRVVYMKDGLIMGAEA